MSAPARGAVTRFHLSAFTSRLRASGASRAPSWPRRSARDGQPDTATARGVGAVPGAGAAPQGPAEVKACSGVSSWAQHGAGTGGGRTARKG